RTGRPGEGAGVEGQLFAEALQQVAGSAGGPAGRAEDPAQHVSCGGAVGYLLAHGHPFCGTTWTYTAVRMKLAKNSSMNVMTTDWLTASPTPFGPPPACSPL